MYACSNIPFHHTGVAPGVDAGPSDRRADDADIGAFLGCLTDGRFRFPAPHQQPLCEWLSGALAGCPSWPAGADLVWDPTPEAPLTVQDASLRVPALSVLRVGPGTVMGEEGQPLHGLLARWETAHPAAWCPAEDSPARCFTPSPGDLFDVLALALLAFRQCGPQRLGGPATDAGAPAMRLRQELADWLQTPAGRHCGIPSLPARGEPPWQPGGGAALVSVEGMERIPRLAPEGHLQAGTLALEERLLRDGGWSPALEHLVPTLLARLPLTHRFRVYGLRVHHAGHLTVYGQPKWSANDITLFREAGGRLRHQCGRSMLPECPQGPDSFIEAACSVPFGRLATLYPHIREELADIMALNPELMRIRLAISQKELPGDQELQLRVCLVNGRVTPAGEQLLHPCRPQRPVTGDDLWRWYRPRGAALRRSPQALAGEGVSVLHAHFLASPLHPTRAGRALMQAGGQPYTLRKQTDCGALLRRLFPELMYVYESMGELTRYLGSLEPAVRTLVPAEMIHEANAFRNAARAAETVAMPAGWEWRSGRAGMPHTTHTAHTAQTVQAAHTTPPPRRL